MNKKFSENDRLLLRNIFAPEVVTVPFSDSHQINMCQQPDGEIRHYGYKKIKDEYRRVYIASKDAGLSWKTFFVSDEQENGPMTQSPWSGDFIAIARSDKHNTSYVQFNSPILPALNQEPEGVYVIRSSQGPGSKEHTLKKILDSALLEIRQPIPMLSRKRWLCTTQKWDNGALTSVVLLSDDDGENWKEIVLESVPPHVQALPHRGMRWQQYSCEPTIIELNKDKLMLISRTSQDVHYVYYSNDAGETWTCPEPSKFFHATTTMPTLFRLHDGRILLFWCNTQPLPELDHSTQTELSKDEKTGVWEDVFTNRDACHAAISSDDGETWAGFREINLNPIRNAADYRSNGGFDVMDKSVHQFQALELPGNKILLAFGQAPCSRKIVIFDPQWLYETGRIEDFTDGLVNLSTHTYVKSFSGGKREGYSGHCSWNRTNGALLVRSPDKTRNEVLQLARIHDERLFSEIQGAVWNFPASRTGKVSIMLRIEGSGIRVSLTDRWFNPIDISISSLAQLSFTLSKKDIPEDSFWTTIDIRWDLDACTANIYTNDNHFRTLNISSEAPAGFSYLHMQSTAEKVDFKGTLIRCLEKSDLTKDEIVLKKV